MKTSTQIIVLCFIFILPNSLSTNSDYSHPIIFHNHELPGWTLFPFEISAIEGEKLRVLYSQNMLTPMTLTCRARDRIQWKVDGFGNTSNLEGIPASNSGFKQISLTIQGTNSSSLTTDSSDTYASISVSCQLDSHNIRDDLLVFIRGVKVQTLFAEVNVVNDTQVIPCITTNPTAPVNLYLRTYGYELPVDTIDDTLRYLHLEGFRSDYFFNGIFICKQDSFKVEIQAYTRLYSPKQHYYSKGNVPPKTSKRQLKQISLVKHNSTEKSISENVEFFPKLDYNRAFSDETITFICASNSEISVELAITNIWDPSNSYPYDLKSNNHKLNLSYIVQDKNHKIAKLAYMGSKHIKGFINCTAVSPTTKANISVKHWLFEFIPAPIITFKNYEKEIQCISQNGLTTELRTLQCQNGIECGFLKSVCLKGDYECQRGNEELWLPSKNGDCSHSPYPRDNCIMVKYAYYHGIAMCIVEGLPRKWEFFESLENRKYINWIDAHPDEILLLDELKSTIYTDDFTTFTCYSVSYLFVGSLQFGIQFKNGSIVQLKDNQDTVRITIANSENRWLVKDLNYIAILDIILPREAVGIYCFASWWNSTDRLNTSRMFESRNMTLPKMIGKNNDAPQFLSLADNKGTLTCNATGEPKPDWEWYFNNKRVRDIFPELKSGVVNGEAFLEIPYLESTKEQKIKYYGDYHCEAKNRLGTVKRTFRVGGDQSNDPSAMTISLGSIFSVIFVIVVTVLIIFIRKYRRAKQEIRNLTDTEVQEFYEGRLDLVAKDSDVNIQTVDLQPYDTGYEIPFADLEFSFCETRMLGSGEFAFVVRGLIVSKGMPCALKISKPSTDVTRFKSLLSEVKIMSYIGKHENVMALIGVCTEGIRTRSIYIATDICDLGSVLEYLRNPKLSFVNLLNANQQIDLELLPENLPETNTCTTLDLISFAAQIAKGMEYLAYKSIVHADLALRNVLLTCDKIAKISDFGLSKRLYESINYVKKSRSPLPWRWMALESLKTLTFSTKSDVWAYGVTLFEIFTFGDIPFPNETWTNEFVARLEDGMRMGRPQYSTQEIYSKIVSCWENDPGLRPEFGNLREFFEQMLETNTDRISENKRSMSPPRYVEVING